MRRSIRNFNIPPGKPRAFDHHLCSGSRKSWEFEKACFKKFKYPGGRGLSQGMLTFHIVSFYKIRQGELSRVLTFFMIIFCKAISLISSPMAFIVSQKNREWNTQRTYEYYISYSQWRDLVSRFRHTASINPQHVANFSL